MGRMDGKVAVITGGARGQGRSHAVRLAEEGAQIAICDIAHDVDACPYPLGTEADMAETVRLVEDLDLKGVWLSAKAVIPHMIAGGDGGSIVMTSSAAGKNPFYSFMAYVAAKHGVIGLMRSLAAELAPHSIRVNAICPTMADTGMINNDAIQSLFAGKESGGTREDVMFPAKTLNLLPVSLIDPVDLSNAVLYLSSDEGRYVTGQALSIDAGSDVQPAGIPPWTVEVLMGG